MNHIYKYTVDSFGFVSGAIWGWLFRDERDDFDECEGCCGCPGKEVEP